MQDISEIKERIILARNALGLTQKQVAQQMVSKQYTISRQETGLVYPSLQYLSFLEKQGINLNWLISGKGQVIKQENINWDINKKLVVSSLF